MNRRLTEGDAATCDNVEASIDDHLGEISLPILYVASAGGDGAYGYHMLTLADTDITKFNVQLLPDEQRALDLGHADLFLATDAQKLVWKPILDWLVAHR